MVPSGYISLRPEIPVVPSGFEMLVTIVHLYTATKIGIVKIINSLGQLKWKVENKHEILALQIIKRSIFEKRREEHYFH